MRVLVTGASGFLGSHLVDSLLADGHEVLGIDNFYTGAKSNLSQHQENGRLELMRHDVTFPLFVEVDAIYNLASAASPKHYQSDPVQTTKTSVLGAINLLGLAKRLRVPIFQASTSEVYGDPEVSPQAESYWGNVNPIGPRACYDEGKRVAETLFFDYKRQHGVDTRVARIFNTYGPRMSIGDGRVVSNFIVQALRGEPLTIYGEGLQTRSFCYVSDLIRGIRSLMDYVGPDLESPINLGNPTELTMLDLAEKILELTKSTSELEFFELPEDDPRQRRPDTSMALKTLNWAANVSLEDGLSETVDYFRHALKS